MNIYFEMSKEITTNHTLKKLADIANIMKSKKIS